MARTVRPSESPVAWREGGGREREREGGRGREREGGNKGERSRERDIEV